MIWNGKSLWFISVRWYHFLFTSRCVSHYKDHITDVIPTLADWRFKFLYTNEAKLVNDGIQYLFSSVVLH